jgi:hypothetical protein
MSDTQLVSGLIVMNSNPWIRRPTGDKFLISGMYRNRRYVVVKFQCLEKNVTAGSANHNALRSAGNTLQRQK